MTATDNILVRTADTILFGRGGTGRYLYRRLVGRGLLPASAPATWDTLTRFYEREDPE